MMTEKEQNKLVGALICAGCGVLLIMESWFYLGLWRLILGGAFFGFGVVRACLLIFPAKAKQ